MAATYLSSYINLGFLPTLSSTLTGQSRMDSTAAAQPPPQPPPLSHSHSMKQKSDVDSLVMSHRENAQTRSQQQLQQQHGPVFGVQPPRQQQQQQQPLPTTSNNSFQHHHHQQQQSSHQSSAHSIPHQSNFHISHHQQQHPHHYNQAFPPQTAPVVGDSMSISTLNSLPPVSVTSKPATSNLDAQAMSVSADKYESYEDISVSNCHEEYSAEILEFMYTMEAKTMPSPLYMEKQQEINWKLRKTLVIWLIEVHAEYDLRPETLYLAINYLDRICVRRSVNKSKYQLLGVTALWVAAKYEENHGKVPTLKNLSYICCNTYSEAEFVAMEQTILRELHFVMGHPTGEAFMKAHCNGLDIAMGMHSSNPNGQPELVLSATVPIMLRVTARLVMEITLVHKRFMNYRPSLISKACLLMAELLIGNLFSCPAHLVSGSMPSFGAADANGADSARSNFEQVFSYDTQTTTVSLITIEPLLSKLLAHLEDCISNPPKQVIDKYSSSKFINVGKHLKVWVTNMHRRHSLQVSPSFLRIDTSFALRDPNSGLLTPPKDALTGSFSWNTPNNSSDHMMTIVASPVMEEIAATTLNMYAAGGDDASQYWTTTPSPAINDYSAANYTSSASSTTSNTYNQFSKPPMNPKDMFKSKLMQRHASLPPMQQKQPTTTQFQQPQPQHHPQHNTASFLTQEEKFEVLPSISISNCFGFSPNTEPLPSVLQPTPASIMDCDVAHHAAEQNKGWGELFEMIHAAEVEHDETFLANLNGWMTSSASSSNQNPATCLGSSHYPHHHHQDFHVMGSNNNASMANSFVDLSSRHASSVSSVGSATLVSASLGLSSNFQADLNSGHAGVSHMGGNPASAYAAASLGFNAPPGSVRSMASTTSASTVGSVGSNLAHHVQHLGISSSSCDENGFEVKAGGMAAVAVAGGMVGIAGNTVLAASC